MHHQVAQVVHVGIGRMRRRPVQFGINRAKFAQSIGAEGREHHEAVDRQRPVPLRQRERRIGAGVQVQVRPQHLRLTDRHIGLQTHRSLASPPAPGPPGRLQGLAAAFDQRYRGFDDAAPGLRPDRLHRLRAGACETPPVEPGLRRLFDHRQAFGHAACQFLMQPWRALGAGQSPQHMGQRCGVDGRRSGGGI